MLSIYCISVVVYDTELDISWPKQIICHLLCFCLFLCDNFSNVGEHFHLILRPPCFRSKTFIPLLPNTVPAWWYSILQSSGTRDKSTVLLFCPPTSLEPLLLRSVLVIHSHPIRVGQSERNDSRQDAHLQYRCSHIYCRPWHQPDAGACCCTFCCWLCHFVFPSIFSHLLKWCISAVLLRCSNHKLPCCHH